MIVYNPVQIKELGHEFYDGDKFTVRYQLRKRLGGLFKIMFVPMGPNISDIEGIENFIKWSSEKQMTKIIIELPLIFNTSVRDMFQEKLVMNNFIEEPYLIHDEETLLIQKGDYNLDSDTRRKIRYAQKRCKLKTNEQGTLSDAYKVYTESSKRIGFNPKSKVAFEKLLESGILITSYSNNTGEPIGFILGSLFELEANTGEAKKFCYIVYSGTNNEGRKSKTGYYLRDLLIKKAFKEFNVDFVDQGGAGRRADYPYLSFKKQFGGEFYPFGGRYVKTHYL